jgi:hypothetical protein
MPIKNLERQSILLKAPGATPVSEKIRLRKRFEAIRGGAIWYHKAHI